MPKAFEFALSADDFDAYLRAGRWSAGADDNIAGEAVSGDFVERLVLAYNEHPTLAAAHQGLGLIALVLGIAEWGVVGTNLPDDPAEKDWKSDTGEDSGKHVMSYAVGGVGISHADVGDLETYVESVAASDLVPAEHKAALRRLSTIKYRKKGILYDEVRAAGRCSDSPGDEDLRGERFDHFEGPAGTRYCSDYANNALTEQDWVVFRTWMRASLRTPEGQRFLLELWFRKYWHPTVVKVPGGEGEAEERLVNVRIRNSAPAVADAAINRQPPLSGAAGRVQRQIDGYADWKLNTARRRWKLMLRPVVLYRHFSGLPQLTGITCK